MSVLRSHPSRPSDVIALPEERPGWAPPSPPQESPSGGQRRWIRLVVAVVAGMVVAVALLPSGRGPARQDSTPVVDVATENAVIAVLRVYDAEVRLVEAAAPATPLFAVPGPLGRARRIREAAAAVEAVVAELRDQGVAPGTPAETYLASADHDALVAAAREIAGRADVVAVLGEVHDVVYGGAGVGSTQGAGQRLEEALAATGWQAADRWGRNLLDAVAAGRTDGPGAATARADAVAEWAAAADRLGPAAGEHLVAFLNGIDPDVLAVLDGHPLAGPALDRLR